ncbi:hypothetical protein ACEQ8H_007572 [Pleosporales sp. CAS-2024a]
MASLKTLLPLITVVPAHVNAWGNLGHTTIAYIAQSFVSDATEQYAQKLLGDASDAYLANVATWADTYRATTAGKFSAPYHFLDALDSPPQTCDVDYERDCPKEGCIISAIANYSSRALDTDISTTEQQMALKWVVHFLGDVHQPLHVENLDVGGNDIDVLFSGASTNLHAAWDTAMPQKDAGSFTQAHASTWAQNLTSQIKTGQYKSLAKSWLTGLDASNPINSSMVWAKDTNSYVCTTVLPNGVSAVENQELSGAYYNTAIPVISLQIAKAGYRLAAWLDAIVEQANNGLEIGSTEAMEKRGTAKLEPWMEAARQARRDFGDDCGCGVNDHMH